MNNKIKLSVGLMLGILLGLFSVATPASAMTCNSATITGTVNVVNVPTWANFVYSTNYNTVANNGGTATTTQNYDNKGSSAISQYISGLSANTTYYYRLIVSDNTGTYPAPGVASFTTPNCQQTQYTVSTNAGAGGSISPSSQQVTSGNTTTFSVNPNSGYTINSTSGCNGYLNGNTYTTGAITSNCTVNASFNAIQNQNPTVTLNANPSTIQSGQSSTLSWSSTNANSCLPSWTFSSTATSGSQTVSPASTTTYNITCTNSTGQSANASATVYVNQNQQQPTVSLYASPSNIQSGQSSTLTWNSQNATSCSPSWAFGGTSTSGSSVVYPTSTTSYNVTCYGNGTSAYASATVYVAQVQNTTCRDTNANNYGGLLPCTYNQVNYQPTVVLYADQASVAYGGTTTIRWSTTNATSCFASGGSVGWAGTKSIGPGAFYTGSLTASRTYSITCSNNVGSATDTTTVNVRGIVINNPRPATSLVLISSSVDRNQPIVPTIDNTRPHPGDEINYTVNYQNIGTGAITGLTLRMDLPYEVDYMFSNPSNPTRTGNTLIFNLGTLRANSQGTVTVRVKVRENIPAGTNLNFPATLSYIDPSGFPQSVSANVSAQVWSEPVAVTNVVPAVVVPLGASVFGAGFLPVNLFGWLLLLVLVLGLALLAKYLFGSPFAKQTTTTSNDPSGIKRTTTTTIQ